MTISTAPCSPPMAGRYPIPALVGKPGGTVPSDLEIRCPAIGRGRLAHPPRRAQPRPRRRRKARGRSAGSGPSISRPSSAKVPKPEAAELDLEIVEGEDAPRSGRRTVSNRSASSAISSPRAAGPLACIRHCRYTSMAATPPSARTGYRAVLDNSHCHHGAARLAGTEAAPRYFVRSERRGSPASEPTGG